MTDQAGPARVGERATDRAGETEPQRGRCCAVCGTRLSLYNPGPHCWQHTMGHPWRGPSAKPKY